MYSNELAKWSPARKPAGDGEDKLQVNRYSGQEPKKIVYKGEQQWPHKCISCQQVRQNTITNIYYIMDIV